MKWWVWGLGFVRKVYVCHEVVCMCGGIMGVWGGELYVCVVR